MNSKIQLSVSRKNKTQLEISFNSDAGPVVAILDKR
ncbi:Uncharacterised protein [Serratia fonticola]|uniref:Uncharacterized protein n=1 Tax=Serratia fonticola TaxID=47917 RepID=A0A4U9UN17_SERFO|nr:Uncharacterised protein [Serratia fonticola]